MPKTSIGLYVFNGEKYLEDAIASILGQTESDFEIVISDNASTDRTAEISQSFHDSRIRFYSSDVNRGASWNHSRVFELSRGRYFKWAAYDDILQPEFLEACLEALERDPEVVLAYTDIEAINSEGLSQSAFSLPVNPTGASAHWRFGQLMLRKHACQHVFGVIRRDALEKTDLIGPFIGSDRVLLTHLALLGRFERIPKPLFRWRLINDKWNSRSDNWKSPHEG